MQHIIIPVLHTHVVYYATHYNPSATHPCSLLCNTLLSQCYTPMQFIMQHIIIPVLHTHAVYYATHYYPSDTHPCSLLCNTLLSQCYTPMQFIMQHIIIPVLHTHAVYYATHYYPSVTHPCSFEVVFDSSMPPICKLTPSASEPHFLLCGHVETLKS